MLPIVMKFIYLHKHYTN